MAILTRACAGSYIMTTEQTKLDLAVQPIDGFISKRLRFVDNCDANRHVFVDGVAAYVYRVGDKVQQRNVIVSLLRANLATELELSNAFGVSLRSVSRWNSKYNLEGILGLVDKDRCGAPEKINAKLRGQILELRGQRVKVNEIARLLNIGLGSVCRVLYAEPAERQTEMTFLEADDGKVDSEVYCETFPLGADAASSDTAQKTAAAESASPEVLGDLNGAQRGDPLDRTMDRLMARLGLLEDAAPLFVEGQRIEFAGVLLACATSEMQRYLDVVKKAYQSFGASFYGIRGTFLTLIFMLLLRIKNCEQIREYNPVTIGKLLGLDRAPEVKTLRRKLRLLYAREQSLQCMNQIQSLRMDSNDPQLLATLYIDGHVKAYYGKHRIGSTYSGRLHKVVRGCTDYWVNVRGGSPLCVISTDFNDAMTLVLVDIVKDIKEEYRSRGIDITNLYIVFDRGGYSAQVFEQLLALKVNIITYNRGSTDPVDMRLFVDKPTVINNRTYPAPPIERTTELAVYEKVCNDDGGSRKAVVKKTDRVVKLREILILRNDQGITSILTNIRDPQPDAADIAAQLFSRWPQENYLKYMMEEFALDHLHAYGAEDIKQAIEHPNPEYNKIKNELSALTSNMEKTVGRQTMKKLESTPGAFARLQKKLANIKIKGFHSIKECLEKIASLQRLLPSIKERISIDDHKRLRSESRTFHQFLKMSAYHTETELVDVLRQFYPDHHGDARTVLTAMLKSSGTLTVEKEHLVVTIDRQSSPQRTMLLQCVCDKLNQRSAVYPGSRLTLRFRTEIAT
jgi:hypothetical protein